MHVDSRFNSSRECSQEELLLLELIDELTRKLENGFRDPNFGRTEQICEALVLLARMLSSFLPQSEPPIAQRSEIDDYIEDMIDPEFGLKPARTIIERAASKILGDNVTEQSCRAPRRSRHDRESD